MNSDGISYNSRRRNGLSNKQHKINGFASLRISITKPTDTTGELIKRVNKNVTLYKSILPTSTYTYINIHRFLMVIKVNYYAWKIL